MIPLPQDLSQQADGLKAMLVGAGAVAFPIIGGIIRNWNDWRREGGDTRRLEETARRDTLDDAMKLTDRLEAENARLLLSCQAVSRRADEMEARGRYHWRIARAYHHALGNVLVLAKKAEDDINYPPGFGMPMDENFSVYVDGRYRIPPPDARRGRIAAGGLVGLLHAGMARSGGW